MLGDAGGVFCIDENLELMLLIHDPRREGDFESGRGSVGTLSVLGRPSIFGRF
jgi:hypothetical protein